MGKTLAGFTFPAIAGSEGVGIVEKVGSAVTYFKENDTVMLIKPFQGTFFFNQITYRNLD
jgi:Zn-dependent alcohol dehydrogenase